MKDMTQKKVCTMAPPSLTHLEMSDIFTADEDIKNFIGGAEKPISFLDESVPFDLGKDENSQPIIKTWREYAYHKESLDGTTVLISAGHPVRYKDGRCVSVSNRDKGILEFAKALGVNDMLTKSEFETLWKSEKYLEINQEV